MVNTIMIFRRIMEKMPTPQDCCASADLNGQSAIKTILCSQRWASQNQLRLVTRNLFLPARSRLGGSTAIFLQLIMQGFQTDSEDLGGPGLVVSGAFQSFQDQQPLRLFHRCAYSEADGVGIVGAAAQRGVTETRRQMFGFNHPSVTDNHSALNRVAQLANIARP